MSRLDKLISELCPNGVDFKPLEQCCTVLDNKRKPVTKASRQEGEYPYYGANGIQDYVAEYIFDGTFLLVGEDGSVITPNGTPVVNWAEGKIWVNNHAHIIEEKSGVLLRYLYHYLQIVNVKPLIHGNIPKLTGGDFRAIQIPVPPLPVQHEIVRILDSFTELTVELTTELTTELAARKKQYEYYSSEQFPSIKESNYDWVELGSIATVTKLAGFEFTKYVVYSETGNVIALRGLNVKNGHLVLDDVKYIDNSDLTMLSRSKLHIGDMLFTYVGTVGQVALIDKNDKYYLAPNVALVRINDKKYLPKYMMYYFLTNKFKEEQIAKLLQASSMQNIPMEKIRKFKLPVITLEEQQRIVSILDQFDMLCNGINNGLPKEIAIRQKQYEYYRDKLLTFPKAEVSQ